MPKRWSPYHPAGEHNHRGTSKGTGMSDDYDDYDDGTMEILSCSYPKYYIRLNTVIEDFKIIPFYINGNDNIDCSIESWTDFFNSLIDNKELKTYNLRFQDITKHDFFDRMDDFPEDEVIVEEDNEGYGTYIKKQDFFVLAKYYGLNEKKYCKKVMEEILRKYRFMLELFQHNIDDNQSTSKQGYCKTANANATRQGSILKQWQDAFRYMIEIRDLCIKEGKAKRTERTLWAMFEKRGYKVNKTQMRFFKTLLPDGYVDKEGGAPKQS